MPRVSVIIPTYNSARFITATLDSVLGQSFRDFEIIVVDDGSTDNTREVVRPYLNSIDYIYQQNSERSVARNNALSRARGEYIAFLDSDDLWTPEKLARQVAVLDDHPQVSLVFTQARYVDEGGKPVSFAGQTIDGQPGKELVIVDYSIPLLSSNVIAGGGSAAMTRRRLLEEVGNFDLDLVQSEDWDMWVRLARLGPFAYIPEPLTSYRVYGWKKLLSRQMDEESIQQHMRILDKNLAGWQGDPQEKLRLRNDALRFALVLATQAAYQLDRIPAGQDFLRRAIQVDPSLGAREKLMWLYVDRAKIIETDTGSYDEALAFLKRALDGLPAELNSQQPFYNQAAGWLYISGAFQQYEKGNLPEVRRLVRRALLTTPDVLRNRGVLSIVIKSLFAHSSPRTAQS